ncbi:MAG: sigma-70 family RNA polymerase sigma factor [Pseudomonadota bacterium]
MLLSMSNAATQKADVQAIRSGAKDYVARATAGDTRAYEHLYRAHCGQIYALCLRMTANAAEAEDATQDAFIQAWSKLATFRGDSAFSSWLHRIAVNVVLTQMRKRKREAQKMALVVPDEAPDTQTAHDMPDIERAIAALPERARQVFVLAGVYGYTHEQVATTLDVAVGTCKAHLHRARQMLQEHLDT